MAPEQTVLQKYPAYEATIGIEVHVQLDTASKIFCPCPNKALAEPNTLICPICLGHPGTLPVLNETVVDYAIMMGLATNSAIAPQCGFARKHYFYPDLSKGYQITQNNDPICANGFITIFLDDGSTKNIRLVRIHMEEDAGKNLHSATTAESFVDFNRCGAPLLEIVSYPDLTDAQQARAYLKQLRNIVLHLGISSGNMEEGALRADTNISVRKRGAEKLGTRCELKNINSFKFIADAIEYEIERQINTLESGGRIFQETRLWDTKEKVTRLMRSKEESSDYRYFPEPDLPILVIDQVWVDRIKQRIPELPEQKFRRLLNLGLSSQESAVFVDDLALSAYFDQAYRLYPNKQIVNWVLRNVIGYLKEHKLELAQLKVTPTHLAELVRLIDEGQINSSVAQEVFELAAAHGAYPSAIVKEKGLQQIGSPEELERAVLEIIGKHSQQVNEYKEGNTRLFGFFVGQVMKATGGKGNPVIINDLLKKHLG